MGLCLRCPIAVNGGRSWAVLISFLRFKFGNEWFYLLVVVVVVVVMIVFRGGCCCGGLTLVSALETLLVDWNES